MPAPTVCHELDCPNLARNGARCDECHAARRRASDRRRPNATARGYDGAWRRTRARYLRDHPFCEYACGAPSVDVHHIDGQGPLGARGHDDGNLLALCPNCHAHTTATEQPAGWNAPA